MQKTNMPYREMKQGLIEIFNKSNAKGVLLGMLNMKIPNQLRPEGRGKVTEAEDRRLRKKTLISVKWAEEM